LLGGEFLGEAGDAEATGEHGGDFLGVSFVLKGEGEDLVFDEGAAVMGIEGGSDDGFDAEVGSGLGCGFFGSAGAVVRTCDEDELAAGLLVGDGGVLEVSGLGVWKGGDLLIGNGDGSVTKVLSVGPSEAGGHEVLKFAGVF